MTHRQLAELEGEVGRLSALSEAARRSAFPSVRNVATLGGNLGTRGLPGPDLVPALLAFEAEIELVSFGETVRLGVDQFLADRERCLVGRLLTRVFVSKPSPD